jgi:hypothetical protein
MLSIGVRSAQTQMIEPDHTIRTQLAESNCTKPITI